MRVLVTRPEPDASREAAALAARGHQGVKAPLLVIEPIEDVALELDGAQALIVTSRNALRALASHRDLGRARKLRLFAVGGATASAARELGFAEVTEGPGNGAGLAEVIEAEAKPADGVLMHLAGETLAFDLKSALEAKGFSVRQPVLYRSVQATQLPLEALSLIRDSTLDGVILMSPRTAQTFADLLAKHGLVTQGKRLVCYCISKAVAEVLSPLGFGVRVASHPREEDVLALVSAEAASS